MRRPRGRLPTAWNRLQATSCLCAQRTLLRRGARASPSAQRPLNFQECIAPNGCGAAAGHARQQRVPPAPISRGLLQRRRLSTSSSYKCCWIFERTPATGHVGALSGAARPCGGRAIRQGWDPPPAAPSALPGGGASPRAKRRRRPQAPDACATRMHGNAGGTGVCAGAPIGGPESGCACAAVAAAAAAPAAPGRATPPRAHRRRSAAAPKCHAPHARRRRDGQRRIGTDRNLELWTLGCGGRRRGGRRAGRRRALRRGAPCRRARRNIAAARASAAASPATSRRARASTAAVAPATALLARCVGRQCRRALHTKQRCARYWVELCDGYGSWVGVLGSRGAAASELVKLRPRRDVLGHGAVSPWSEFDPKMVNIGRDHLGMSKIGPGGAQRPARGGLTPDSLSLCERKGVVKRVVGVGRGVVKKRPLLSTIAVPLQYLCSTSVVLVLCQ